MTFEDKALANPNFLPQLFSVEVVPGFEDCRFNFTSVKATIPLLQIFSAHPENKPEQDLTPSNLMFSIGGLPPMGSAFEATAPSLKQGTMHRYRISTFDSSNGEAEAFGTFTTKRRDVNAQISNVMVWDPGDPAEGEVYMQFGLFQVRTTTWSPAAGKIEELGYVTRPTGDIEHGQTIDGFQFSSSGQITGTGVSDFLRVVFYAKDSDDDFYLPHYEPAGYYGCSSSQTAGCDADLNPVASAQGYDDGEWVRLVQDFRNLPTTPGPHVFYIELKSTWGVVCDVYGRLTINVIEGPEPTVYSTREGP